MHLNDEQIQRLLDGELDTNSEGVVRRHLAACRDCARGVEEARREQDVIFDLLASTDQPAPPVDAETLIGRRVTPPAVWVRRVAGFVIAVALAGVAYALPGSPVPVLLGRVAEWFTGGGQPTQERQATQPVTSGIAVRPNERFAIRFVSAQAVGVAKVSLTNGPDVVVRVTGGTVTFTTESDRLDVDNRGSDADYEIELPRDAPSVEIFVGDRRLIRKDGQRFVVDDRADTDDQYILRLAPPEPLRE